MGVAEGKGALEGASNRIERARQGMRWVMPLYVSLLSCRRGDAVREDVGKGKEGKGLGG